MKPSQIFSHWEQVRADLVATIDMFNEDELTFVPFKGSWSAGQIMLHIADCENYWLHWVVRQEIEQWKYYDFTDHPTKPAIEDVLEGTRKKTIAFLDSLDECDLDTVYKTPEGQAFTLRWIIWHVLEHEIHHRGELSLALGLLGRNGLDV
ncbi:MAG: DinB family protein [Anaerolineales bacterium]|jgi:uncharacterized damage-inducible protein DinB